MKVKINESQLHSLIMESIKKILNESSYSFRDKGRITIYPYEHFCENDDEEDILDQCGIKPEYKVTCSVTRIHEDGVMYDSNHEGYPGYDDEDDFEIDDDGGFENDMERVKSVNPALYEKVMKKFYYMEAKSPNGKIDLYDEIEWEGEEPYSDDLR